MNTIKNSLNFLVKNFIIFFICIMWCNFYIKNKTISFTIALLLTLIISFILTNVFNQTKNNQQLKNLKKNEINDFKLYLKTIDNKETIKLIKLLLDNNYDQKNEIFIYKQNIACFNVLKEELTESLLIKCCVDAKKVNLNKIIIFCLDAKENLNLFCKSIKEFEIEIYNHKIILEKLKIKNFTFNAPIEIRKNTKLTFQTFFNLFFRKKNAKAFFILGVITFISSFLTFYKLYYYIFTTILLIFGIICLMKKKDITKTSFI